MLPLSFSLAVPGCDKAEAVAGMAEGHRELTPPCPPSALREGVYRWVSGGSRRWELPGASPGPAVGGCWMWSAETLCPLPGEGEVGPFPNPENCDCPSLAVQGRGRMLPLEILSGAP